jgi:hypothetical protein
MATETVNGLVFPFQVESGSTMFKITKSFCGGEGSFGMALQALPRNLIVMRVFMAGYTICKRNIREFLEFFPIFGGNGMAFLAIYR